MEQSMFDENLFKFGVPAAAALGSLMLTWGLLAWAGDVARRISYNLRLRQGRLAFLPQEVAVVGRLAEPALYGTAGVNWPALQAVSGVFGILLASLVFPFPLSVVGSALGFLPLFARNYLKRQGQARMRRQVRSFVDELGLMPLSSGLAPALSRIAERDTPGVLHERLRLHVRAQQLCNDALGVLRALADDLRSDDLADLCRQMDAARRGGGSVEETLREAAQEMSAEMLAQARLAAEGAPNRLLLPALVTLFPPVLVLALYPAMMYLVDSLTTVGSGHPPF